MTAKMTRSEFEYQMAHAMTKGRDSAAAGAELAQKAGVEWLPEQVDPVVGEPLTEETRRIDGVAVVANADNKTIYQYDANKDRWGLAGMQVWHEWDSLTGCRIVFVPAEPVTEQKHETTVIKVVGMWDWRCTCGCHGRNYETRSAAYYWAERHDGTHVAAQS